MAGDQELLRVSRNPRHEGALRRSPTVSALCRPCITDLLVLACPFGCAGMEHGAVLGIIIQSAHALDGIAQFAGLRLHLVHGMSTAAMGSAPLPLLEAAARWFGGQEMGPGLRHGRHGCQGQLQHQGGGRHRLRATTRALRARVRFSMRSGVLWPVKMLAA